MKETSVRPEVYRRDFAIEWQVGDIVYYPTLRFDSQKDFLAHLTKYDCFYATDKPINIESTFVLTKCFVHEVIEVPQELLLEIGEEEDETEPRELMCILEPLTRDKNNPSEDAWIGGHDMLASVYRDEYYFGGTLQEDDLKFVQSDVSLIYREALRQVKETELFEKVFMDTVMRNEIAKGHVVRSIESLQLYLGKKLMEEAVFNVSKIVERVERAFKA